MSFKINYISSVSFHQKLLQTKSDIRTTKTVLILLSTSILAAATGGIYQAQTERMLRYYDDFRRENLCQKEVRSFCLNSNFFYSVDNDIVGCTFS